MNLLRWVAIIEGWSYLILLGVCMPLKYIFNLPKLTYPVGLAHGVLFVAYLFLVLWQSKKNNWNLLLTTWLGALSLLPFGTFYADKKYFRKVTF